MACVLAISLLAAGCAAQTTASEPSATTTRPESQPNATTTTVPTIFETEPVETKPPIVEPSEYITITTPAKNDDGLVFQPLDPSNGYKIDLNKDGVLEKISFVAPTEEFSDYYFLVLNDQYAEFGDEDDWGSSWPVIVDLDVKDEDYDLIYYHGQAEFWSTNFYYYHAGKLVFRGRIFDDFMIYEDYIYLKPIALFTGKIDGQGNIISVGTNNLCENANFDVDWKVAPNGLIEVIRSKGYQRLYSVWGIDQKVYGVPVTLKIDLPLYSDPTDAMTKLLAKAGEDAQIIQADDIWFQIRTQHDQLGWFRLENDVQYSVLVGYQAQYTSDVFEGLFLNEGG